MDGRHQRLPTPGGTSTMQRRNTPQEGGARIRRQEDADVVTKPTQRRRQFATDVAQPPDLHPRGRFGDEEQNVHAPNQRKSMSGKTLSFSHSF